MAFFYALVALVALGVGAGIVVTSKDTPTAVFGFALIALGAAILLRAAVRGGGGGRHR